MSDFCFMLRAGIRNLQNEHIHCSSRPDLRGDGPGTIDKAVLEEAGRSKVLIALLSPDWRESDWVISEISAAIGAGVPVLFLMFEGVMPPDLPDTLSTDLIRKLGDIGEMEALIHQICKILDMEAGNNLAFVTNEFRHRMANGKGYEEIIEPTGQGNAAAVSADAREILRTIMTLEREEQHPVALTRVLYDVPDRRHRFLALLAQLEAAGMVKIEGRSVRTLGAQH